MNQQSQLEENQKKIPLKQINTVQQCQNLYQDLMNMTGVAIETQAILNKFQDDPNHPMINISLNRMFLQANTSNTLANAMNEDSEQNEIYDKLLTEKKEVKKYYQKLIKNQQFDERISALLTEYEKYSLSEKPFLNQKPYLPTNEENIQFDEKVVQRLVNAIGHQDQITADICQDPSSFIKPTVEKIEQINIQRQRNANQKLFENFTMLDFSKQLINQCSKSENPNELMQILDKYFKNIEKHFKDFGKEDIYNQIHNELKFNNDQQKEQFKHLLRLLISYDIGTLDTYFCQTLEYLSEQKIPKRITKQ